MHHSALADYLDGEDNLYGLDYVATHGFLCATVVGPKLANWQTVLFDGEEKSIPTKVLSAIVTWQSDLENELKTHERIELPVDEYDVELNTNDAALQSELGDWSVGFVDAMYANEETDWFDFDDDVATLTLPMVVFSGIEEDDDELTAVRKDDALLEQMAGSIQQNLSELYLLFHTPS